MYKGTPLEPPEIACGETSKPWKSQDVDVQLVPPTMWRHHPRASNPPGVLPEKPHETTNISSDPKEASTKSNESRKLIWTGTLVFLTLSYWKLHWSQKPRSSSPSALVSGSQPAAIITSSYGAMTMERQISWVFLGFLVFWEGFRVFSRVLEGFSCVF